MKACGKVTSLHLQRSRCLTSSTYGHAKLTTFNASPLLFSLLYQLKGIGHVAPIYYFLHYVQHPLTLYAAADNRLIRISYAKMLIPALLVGYFIPTASMFLPILSLDTRQWVNGIWQLFPLWVAALLRLLGGCVRDTTQRDRVYNPTADLVYLRFAYVFVGLVSALTYSVICIKSQFPVLDIFFKGTSDPSLSVTSAIDGMARALRYDEIWCFVSGFYWVGLHFYDLRVKGKLPVNWGKIVVVLATSLLLGGPGATISLAWYWREELLAQRPVHVPKA